MLNALRSGANCSAKARVLANIFCGCGCKFGSIFLQIEMQNHSKWQKLEGKARNVGRRFHHSAAFYIGFARYFLLEWFAKKLRFVKYVYHLIVKKQMCFRILRLPLSLYYENKAIHGQLGNNVLSRKIEVFLLSF